MPPATEFCATCEKGPMSKAAMSGHLRSKAHKERAPLPPVEFVQSESGDRESPAPAVNPAPTSGTPAILPELRATGNLRNGERSIKLLRPVCYICNDGGPNTPFDWVGRCTHDPYVTSVRSVVLEPKWGETRPDGSRVQVGTQEVVTFKPHPNWAEITFSYKVNSAQGPSWAFNKGMIPPDELRSPHFPFGIARCCQFKGCYQQSGLREYPQTAYEGIPAGWFCREEEAALVMFADDAETYGLLLVPSDQRALRARNRQLREVLTSA